MIQLESVTKVFQSGRREVKALNDISFCLEAGRFAAIIGKSGSGKSTLLNCMGGLEPPDTGTITCFGTPIYDLSARELSLFQRRSVGFVFQRGNLLSYLTVAENIGFPLTLNHITGSSQARRISELLERIGLASAATALPHELSSGETQRVAMARAIAHNPRILLADEPTANLDSATGRLVVELMHDLGRDHQCTIVMATHDLEITENAETVIHLNDGRIQAE
ncbi:MAG: ABC transporter ATP-binding protein [Deltaproteobacteria bacterium]|nr:ABC transporter ATP-binding protein [Candidatus Anaeroferrophillus wilburensis]MBN2888216.1 ABC transporter ATP-binding protein [Deltaproteobacteria bacterium]